MDRQDIDALLIGALYGELLPADEARLAAHLESHPTDRSAFEGLKSARQAVRESRIFEVQLEPPQALSALLLQEAHRRAPREAKEGWFQRLVRGFAAHPALAAAAMLAIVLGFAGLMSRHGAGVADQKHAETTAAVQPAAVPAGAVNTPPAAPEGAMAGSGYVVGLADSADEAKPGAAQTITPSAVQQGIASRRQDANAETRAQVAHHASNTAAPVDRNANAKRKAGGIVVRGEEHEPKDLDGMLAGDEGYAGGGAAAADQRAAKVAAPTVDKLASPPPPPTAPAQAASGEAQHGSFAAGLAAAPGGPAPVAHTTAAPGTAWARARHAAAVTAVQRGDCAGAARIALAVKRQEPAFYDQVMATDRALAKCQAYIASSIERDAETRKAASRVRATDQK